MILPYIVRAFEFLRLKWNYENYDITHCLKITQNVAFELFDFDIFGQFLSYLLKLTCLVTLFDRKLQVFKNSPK